MELLFRISRQVAMAVRTMTTESDSSSSRSGPPFVKPSEPPIPTARVMKRTAIGAWVVCALALPGCLPFISTDTYPRRTLTIFALFGLSWLVFYRGLYAAILDNARMGSPQAKLAECWGPVPDVLAGQSRLPS
jgi:hypothetical protein